MTDTRELLIQDYVMMERARCAALALALSNEPDFLQHCIEYSIMPDQIEWRRPRYLEMVPTDDDLDFSDV